MPQVIVTNSIDSGGSRPHHAKTTSNNLAFRLPGVRISRRAAFCTHTRAAAKATRAAMILCIGDVLNASALQRMRAILAGASFEDGRATAGLAARLVKNNLQLALGTPVHQEMTRTVLEALGASTALQAAALPRSYRPPLLSRYESGMAYGAHVDEGLMGQPPVRADLSYTLFLSAPEEYEGGELVLMDAPGERRFKLPAGALLVYPSTSLHRVETVRTGTRTVVVGWIQSVCRLDEQREILFDLHRLMCGEFEARGKSEAFDVLAKTRANLLRLFAEA